ncbi:TRAP transporter substrate-binding protein [uncultured Agathobaculum sp.]|uniref:TRAP transporter substrate-binding protein n=1 Tax=uncultured Agathobaculum sp. TaxID=2048140 RepID=UPI003207B1C3
MKKIVSLFCAAAMVLSMAACSGGSNTAGTEDGNATVVKYSVVFASSGTQADGAAVLSDLIEEHSDGRLKMEFYPSSQLGDKIATFEGLQIATIEMTECALTDLSTFNSMWSVFSLPYLWDSGDQAIQTIMDLAVSEVLEADMEANGFKIIAWTDLGSRSIVNTKRPINTPEDLHGLKIRCMEDAVLADATTAMGAIATPLAFSEVYTGMQQGTLDGADYQIPNVYASAWQEICPYMSLTEHFTIPDVVFVSKAWFDRLSAEDQQALLDAGQEFTEQWNSVIWPNATDTAREGLEAAGMTINEVDKEPFIEAVQPVIDEFLENATDEQKNLYNLLIKTREKY